MSTVIRAALIYLVVWLIFRLIGRRTMAQITTFDFVLLLICGDATQQALLGRDHTVTNAALVVLTLVVIDDLLTQLRLRSPRVDRLMEGQPLVLMHNGRVHDEPMQQEGVENEDILHAARHTHGITELSQIQQAVLETSGDISVIPARSDSAPVDPARHQ